MSIYRIADKKIIPLKRTTFAEQGLHERRDLQAMLKEQINVISPDTLIVAEEFGEWVESQRRIDLLAIDKDANLVVIELKRTEDGGHMELQALRYAAMISTLTFERLTKIYARYLKDNGLTMDATESLLEFLEWEEPEEEQFGQEVKIVLASAEFSKELTTSVMWLNDFGLDIRCVRMHPYTSDTGDGQTLLDVQTVIPLPEGADYQIRIHEKKQKARESRQSERDFTKYDVRIVGQEYPAQSKRGMMFRLTSGILGNGGTPEEIVEATKPWRKSRMFEAWEGELSAEDVRERLTKGNHGGQMPKTGRYFCKDGEVFHFNGWTYALSNQWGNETLDAARALKNRFTRLEIEFQPSD